MSDVPVSVCRECGAQLTRSKRGPSSQRCAPCKKERRLRLARKYNRTWRAVNLDRTRDKMRRWREANKEAIKVTRVFGISVPEARDWLAGQELSS